MKIQSMTAEPIAIPFAVSFLHSSASRVETEAILVKVTTNNGVLGIGEGCPRPYVTDESVASSLAFVEDIRAHIKSIDSIAALKHWVSDHREAIDRAPSAWCAVELALLDALAREAQISVEELLGIPTITKEFSYTAVLGVMEPRKLREMIKRYREFGITSWKLKVSQDIAYDEMALRELSHIAPRERIRVDANNCWTEAAQAESFLQQFSHFFWALEEPLQRDNINGMRTLSRKTECRFILDESLVRGSQLVAIQNEEWWLPNLRVSKLGGILRTIEMLECTSPRSVILGAQVGETSILTRAAIVCARAAGPRLIAQEGAFGTMLLERDIVSPVLMFGAGGLLELKQSEPGFGLTLPRP